MSMSTNGTIISINVCMTAGNRNDNDTLILMSNILSTIISSNFEPNMPIVMPITRVNKSIIAYSTTNILIMLFLAKTINLYSTNCLLLLLINSWFAYIKNITIIKNKNTAPISEPF